MHDPIGEVIARHPHAFNERQQTVCGVWGPYGPCVCGDKANHQPGGRFHQGTEA